MTIRPFFLQKNKTNFKNQDTRRWFIYNCQKCGNKKSISLNFKGPTCILILYDILLMLHSIACKHFQFLNQAVLLEKYNNFFSWPVVKRSQKHNFYCFVSNFVSSAGLYKKKFLRKPQKKGYCCYLKKFKTLWHLFLKRV